MLLKVKSLLKEGLDYKNAVIEASLNRFRPVVLTAITTAAGLFPMLFETSTQALYLVPMVISLSFGSVFSIATILLLSPAMFILSEQYKVQKENRESLIALNSDDTISNHTNVKEVEIRA